MDVEFCQILFLHLSYMIYEMIIPFFFFRQLIWWIACLDSKIQNQSCIYWMNCRWLYLFFILLDSLWKYFVEDFSVYNLIFLMYHLMLIINSFFFNPASSSSNIYIFFSCSLSPFSFWNSNRVYSRPFDTVQTYWKAVWSFGFRFFACFHILCLCLNNFL